MSRNEEALLAFAPHSQLTDLRVVNENKNGANSCSSVLRWASSDLSKAWQEMLWDARSTVVMWELYLH